MGNGEIRDLLDKLTYAGSMIVAPSGALCSDVVRGNKEGIVYARCDISTEINQKEMHDICGNYQRTDVFHFAVNKSVLEPMHVTGEGNTPAARDYLPYSEGTETGE